MKVPLMYGQGTLTVDIPDSAELHVVRKPQMPLLKDSVHAATTAIEPVSRIATGKSTACILVCDITRPVPNGLFIKPLVERLHANGIELDQITILIATGLHRPHDDEENALVIGDEWVIKHVNVVNHFARNDSDHVDLGSTRSGTPVKLDRRFVEADVKIATGLVEPHFMAGWSGGRKVVTPGVAHADTIRTLHNARFMDHANARACNLIENPLHSEQLEIIEMLCHATNSAIYAVNTVIDEHRRLGFINFGEIRASHASATEFAEKYCVVSLPHQFETVVTSSAGFPLDLTYYQTVKGMVTPLDIVADGATLIVASECKEGLGSEPFRLSQGRLLEEGDEAFLRRVMPNRLAEIDEWETLEQLKATSKAHVQLFSDGLQGEDRKLTGVDMVDSLQESIEQSIGRSSSKRVAVIPEGPYVIPRYHQVQ